MKSVKEQLIRYMDAGFPILYLNTYEEEKADRIISSMAGGKRILEWTIRGLHDLKEGSFVSDVGLADALEMLLTDQNGLDRSVLVLKDAYSFMEQPQVSARLKFIAQLINQGELDCSVIIVSPIIKIPRDLENHITILTMDYLSQDDIRKVIVDFCKTQEITPLNEAFLNELAMTFKGLTESEICNILALAVSENGEIGRADLSLIIDQKQQVIQKAGILEMVPLKETIKDIGGLENLKKWLQRKAKIFKNINEAEKFGVDAPKGVLIAGMPGCGKSLNAKAAADLFGVPLLRMDMGRLMGKYVGESEANMRKAIALAEAISPCVLWIDELEKAFSGVGGEGSGSDVTTRLFGNFLTWMQEKDSLAFVVATANNIAKMPPELLRKGRFDEIFYVGLPNGKERRKIFEIHIGKRRKSDLNRIDIQKLVDKTNGYSGADIEGVVKDGVEEAFAEDRNSLTTEDILKAIRETHSLSEIMKDSLDQMSKLYKERKFKNASEE